MSRKILLADDSLTIQKVVELTFMEGDYDVTAVGNGDDALVKLEEMSPDIVIADVHMPGADGYRICRAAKEKHPGAPVLLLVGTFEPFEESEATEAGADSHLKKPFDSQELLRLVEELLGATAGVEAVATGITDAAPHEAEVEGIFADVLESDGSSEVAPPADEDVPIATADEPALAPIGGEVEVTASHNGLSDEDVDRIAKRVVELISDEVVREISWDVIPDLAEVVIKSRIRELESQVE